MTAMRMQRQTERARVRRGGLRGQDGRGAEVPARGRRVAAPAPGGGMAVLVLAGAVLFGGAAGAARAQAPAPAPAQDAAAPEDARQVETFTATTADSITVPDVELRINVLRWSTREERDALLALVTPAPGATAGDGEDLDRALQDLPTVGFIWTGASLGYALKYTHRTEAPDGGERLVLVTDRPLGVWDREGPWHGADGAAPAAAAFTVVELRLDADGAGAGKLSLGAPIVFDPPAGLVTLADYASAAVHLTDAQRTPPPYWAR